MSVNLISHLIYSNSKTISSLIKLISLYFNPYMCQVKLFGQSSSRDESTLQFLESHVANAALVQVYHLEIFRRVALRLYHLCNCVCSSVTNVISFEGEADESLVKDAASSPTESVGQCVMSGRVALAF